MSILKDKREEQGYTRETFCKLFGFAEGSVINWELGRSRPNWDILGDVIKAYKIDTDQEVVQLIHELINIKGK